MGILRVFLPSALRYRHCLDALFRVWVREIDRKLLQNTLLSYKFTKVWQHLCESKNKPSKGFQIKKWLRHFLIWYYWLKY